MPNPQQNQLICFRFGALIWPEISRFRFRAEFRRRTIGNTFREIIFGDSQLLEYWQSTREFRDRVALMKDVKSYNRLVQAEGARELWQLNTYGNKG